MNRFLKCYFGYIAVNNILIQQCRCFYKTPKPLTTLYSSHGRMYKFAQMTRKPVEQYFDAFLVIDFEATCGPSFKKLPTQEIIEFPCLWVESKEFRIIGQFHKYVRPVIHPKLQRYCTALTGITDQMLEEQDPFPYVLDDFILWYKDMKNRTKSEKEIFVTCGTWDLETMLPQQCGLLRIEVPEFMMQYIDIKVIFSSLTGIYPKTIKDMLILLNIRRIGKMHRGLDDCKNIHSLLLRFGMNGYYYL